MITEFFGDVIFREEDVIECRTFLPGDKVTFTIGPMEPIRMYVVRIGEKLEEKGE